MRYTLILLLLYIAFFVYATIKVKDKGSEILTDLNIVSKIIFVFSWFYTFAICPIVYICVPLINENIEERKLKLLFGIPCVFCIFFLAFKSKDYIDEDGVERVRRRYKIKFVIYTVAVIISIVLFLISLIMYGSQ